MASEIDEKNCQEKLENLLRGLYSSIKNKEIISMEVTKEIEKCIESGANINQGVLLGVKETPLCAFIQFGSLKAVEICVNNGADVNKIGFKGLTPLTMTICLQRINILKYLIKKGVNVCRVDNRGQLPLSVAVETKNVELIEFLLSNGAKFNLQTVFLELILQDNPDIINCFVRNGLLVNFQYNKRPYYILLHAITAKNFAAVEALVKNGADVNMGACDTTPLCFAIKQRSFKVTKLLLENGADANKAGKDGNKPLQLSIQIGSCFSIIKLLVENGAEINKPDSKGTLPLAEAVKSENFPLVKYLVENGGDVNAITNKQECALSAAAKNSNIPIFQFLINSGAKISVAKSDLELLAEENDDFRAFYQVWRNKSAFGSNQEKA